MKRFIPTIAFILWASTSWAWVGGIIVIDTPADITKPRVAIDGNHAAGLLLRHNYHLITIGAKSAYMVVVSEDAFESVLKPYFTSAAAIANGDKGYKGRDCWKQAYEDYPVAVKRIMLYPYEDRMITVKEAQDLGIPIVPSLVRPPIKWSSLDVTDSVE